MRSGILQNIGRVQQRNALEASLPLDGLVIAQSVEDARRLQEEEERTGRVIMSRSDASKIVEKQQRSSQRRSRSVSRPRYGLNLNEDGIPQAYIDGKAVYDKKVADGEETPEVTKTTPTEEVFVDKTEAGDDKEAEEVKVAEPEAGQVLESLDETAEEQPQQEWLDFCQFEAKRLMQNPEEANRRPEYRKLVNDACVPCSLLDQQALRRQWVIDEHARLMKQHKRFDEYYQEIAKIECQLLAAEKDKIMKQEQAKYEEDLKEYDRVQRDLVEVEAKLKKAEAKKAEAQAAEQRALEENRRLASENAQASYT